MNSEPPTTYVSRGGLKLQHALENWKLKIGNCVALDVGSSTGGFVDCLLQNGASKVYALDTAYGELAWKLRNDPRVVVMERTNILHLEKLPDNIVIPAPARGGLSFGQKAGIQEARIRDDKNVKVDLVTIDAGWTKLELILPIVQQFLKPGGQIIALLKPHYEADKRLLQKGILPTEYLEQTKQEVLEKIKNLGFEIKNSTQSPILGKGGNAEILLQLAVV